MKSPIGRTPVEHELKTWPDFFQQVWEAALDAIDKDEDGVGGGSPREGLIEQIEDIETELHRREVEIS